MRINKSLLFIGVLATSVSLTSCDDEEQYQSHPPIFSDVTFNQETIYAGEPFVATAVQSRQATLVDRTTYAWSLSQNGTSVDAEHHYKDLVIYPYASENPTDTLTIQTPGTYTLTLDASYNISGQSDGATYSNTSQDGSFSYSCSASLFVYKIKVNKRFTVVTKP